MRKLKKSIRLFVDNFRELFAFELMYTLISNAVIIPVVKLMINASVKAAGFEYISNKNLLRFILKPSSAAVIVFILFIVSFCKLFEISAVVFHLGNSINHRKTGVADMVYAGLGTCFRAMNAKNIYVLVYSLLILPLSEFSMISNILSSAGIPDVISYYARKHMVVLILSLLAVSIITLFFVRWIFTISYFVCENYNFDKSRKKSINLVKGNFFKILFSLILWEMLAVCIVMFVIMAFAFIMCMLIRAGVFSENMLSLVSKFSRISVSCFSFLSVPFLCSFICTDCFIRRNRLCETCLYTDTAVRKFSARSAGIFSFILGVSFILNVFYSVDAIENGMGINMELFNDTQISAHRGDSSNAPENTIPAFKLAIEKNADWIELDVQESMDGTVIVMHDSNFKRTAGVNKNVWQTSYSEIQNMNAVSDFTGKYPDTKIPTLEEVIFLAKDKIKLNIEIKPNGHEKNLEKSVAELISLHRLENDCIVSSFSADSLKKIKSENPDIKTAYIMSVAIGNVENIEYADALSINSVFVSENLVDSVHSAGKEIYSWTVNSKSEMIKMKEYDVDNIITDNPELAIDVVNSSEYDNFILRFVIYLFGNI